MWRGLLTALCLSHRCELRVHSPEHLGIIERCTEPFKRALDLKGGELMDLLLK